MMRLGLGLLPHLATCRRNESIVAVPEAHERERMMSLPFDVDDQPAFCGHQWPARDMHDVLVIIPTYNEAGNIRPITAAVLEACPQADILIVDDQSPDGTGDIAERLSSNNAKIHVLHRRGPRGLGAAYMAGFRWALRRSYRQIIQMDADFSHDPRAILLLLKYSDHYDLVIGSRYCSGGKTQGWPLHRCWLSFAANLYARISLGSRISDLTAGFRCWRREVLERIDFARMRSNGYAYQVEMAHLAKQSGARIREVPIVFRERKEGWSKMSPPAARKAAWHVARLAWDRLIGDPPPALMKFVRSESPQPSIPRNVLVLCLGGIGDTVLSFAMLRQLRQRLPQARLTALTMWPQAAELIADLGIFHEIQQHNFQNDQGQRAFAKLFELHRQRFDLSILAYPANRFEFNLASWLVHAKRRVGHIYQNASAITDLRWLLTHQVRQTSRTHNVDENLKLLSQVPGPVIGVGDSPDICLGPLDAQYHRYAEVVLAKIPGPYLGIHAGSNTFKNMTSRRWPAERFAELCQLAHEELGLTPLLFGAGEEIVLNEAIARECTAARVSVAPSIRHTVALMARCSVFVSNDSSLAHIASALDVPTVMIVGPTDPTLVKPYQNGVAVTANMPCAPCYRPSRRPLDCTHLASYACLNELSAERVFQALLGLIHHGSDFEDTLYSIRLNGKIVKKCMTIAANPRRSDASIKLSRN